MGHSCHPIQNYPKVLAVACYEDDDGDDDGYLDEDCTLGCLKFNKHLLASSFCWHMFPISYLTRQISLINNRTRLFQVDYFSKSLTREQKISRDFIKCFIKNMSLLIQGEDQKQEPEKMRFSPHRLKKLIYDAALYESNIFQSIGQDEIRFYKISQISNNFKVLFEIFIDWANLKFRSTLIKDNSFFIVKYKNSRLIYTRSIQKYCSKNHLMIFISKSGQFVTKFMTPFIKQYNSSSFDKKQLSQKNKFHRFLQDFIQESMLFYKKLIPKLEGNVFQLAKSKENYCQNYLICTNLCNNSFYPTFEMYKNNSDIFKNYSRFQCSDKSAFSDSDFKLNSRLYNQNHQRSITLQKRTFLGKKLGIQFDIQTIYHSILFLSQNNYKQQSQYSQQELNQVKNRIQKIFISNLDINFNRKDSYRDEIYNQIQLINQEKIQWMNFDVASLSNLKIGKVQYIIKGNPSLSAKSIQSSIKKGPDSLFYQSMMVLKHQTFFHPKQEKTKAFGQIKWQKTIIQECFKKLYCNFLPKFYITYQALNQTQRKSSENISILSEFLRKGTLNNWLNQNNEHNSIFTKINVILYVLYGIAFIHSQKVLHMDLKPMNILIDKNITPKIIDFGSAYNKEVYEKMRKQKIQYFLSFSIPYTAPQIFMKLKKPLLNSKCDIFSLGLIMHEILFNQSLLTQSIPQLEQIYNELGRILESQIMRDQKLTKEQNILNKFKSKENLLNKIFYCPETLEQDKSGVYSLYMNLIFRSLSCYQEKRPFLGSLIIAIKQCYQNFLEFHNW